MIKRTDKEVLKFVEQTIRDAMLDEGMTPEMLEHDWNMVRASIDLNDPNEVRVTCGKMYEAPPLNLGMLMKYAEFFGTKNINDSRFSHGGCETCDYGSSYGYTLIIKPEAKT